MIKKVILKSFIFLLGNEFIIIILKDPLDYLKLSFLITSTIKGCRQTQGCSKLLLFQNSEIGEIITRSVKFVQSGI